MDKSIRISLTFQDQATGALNAAVARMKSSVSGLTGAFSRGFSGIVNVSKTAVGKVVGGLRSLMQTSRIASLIVGGAFSAMAKGAIEMAAEFEKLPIAAEFLLGNAEAADKFTRSIRDLATETIFGLDEVTNLAKRLVGSTRNTEQSERALRALTDAVAATGGGYAELESSTRAWIQTNAKGKASAEELNRQFSNANIPLLRVLAESIVKNADNPLRQYIATAGTATGVSGKLSKSFESASEKLPILEMRADATRKRLDELKSSGKEGSSTFLSAQATLANYNNQIAKASGTIGQYTAAQKNAGKATKATELTVEGVMAQLQNIGDLDIPGSIAADAITVALEEAFGGANQRLVDSFSGQMEKFQDKLKLTALAFLGLDESFRVVEGSIFDKLVRGLKAINDFLDQNEERIVAFGKVLGESLPANLAVAGALFGMLAGLIFGMIGPVLVAGAAWGVQAAAIGLLIEKAGGFDVVFGKVKSTLETVGTFLSSVFAPVLETMKQLMAENAEPIRQLQEALQNALPVFITLVQVILAVAGAIIGGLLVAFAGILPNIIGFVTGVIQVVTGFLQLIFGLFTMNGDMLKDAVSNIWEGIKNIISNAIMGIINLLAGFVVGVIDFFRGLYNTLVGNSIVPDIVDGILGAFTHLRDAALDLVSGLVSGVAGKFTGLVSSAANWGRDMVSGFVNSFKNAAKGVGDIGREIAGRFGLQFQHGGIVPGPIGEPVLITAHGGERITPRGSNSAPPFANQSGGGGGITINMNGPVTLDSEERIRELAEAVLRISGRQNELARFGVGFTNV